MTATEAVTLYQDAVRERAGVREAYSEARRRLELADGRVAHALSMVARAKLPKAGRRQGVERKAGDRG